MKRLKILHIDSGTSWRGGQRQVLLLAKGLREKGHEQFLIGAQGSPLVDRARSEGLAISGIPMAADWDVRAARRIRARMKTWNVEVVHAHDARAHALAMIALIGSHIPLIVTRRVPFTPRSVRVKYGHRVTRFIAISLAVRRAMMGGGVKGSRISVVHSGIAKRNEVVTPRDWRTELGWPEDTVICGIVGAMSAEKGIDLLEAIGRSFTPSARSRARIVLLGGSADDAREAGGIPVHSAGFVDDIYPAMAGLDVLLHPSRAEGLGTSIIDAMSLGVPPVAFAVGGIPEVIVDGVSGLLVPENDVAQFARAASRLIDDPELRHQLSEGARMRATTFGADEMTKGTEAVYKEVLEG